ncbi:hypothetical protein SRABI70_01564 [Pseudomonas sp. Bi70]|nr:hypothetical protein [Pseudomonas sp. Bi70]CAH0193424.1 hypothetical protein SRABI70_01564 [Pseudomonas sp. Bi70]
MSDFIAMECRALLKRYSTLLAGYMGDVTDVEALRQLLDARQHHKEAR